MSKLFTLTEGLQIQTDDLIRWKPKLSQDCYLALLDWVLSKNKELTDKSTGYDVVRGGQLTEFVLNWKEEV